MLHLMTSFFTVTWPLKMASNITGGIRVDHSSNFLAGFSFFLLFYFFLLRRQHRCEVALKWGVPEREPSAGSWIFKRNIKTFPFSSLSLSLSLFFGCGYWTLLIQAYGYLICFFIGFQSIGLIRFIGAFYGRVFDRYLTAIWWAS